MNEIMTRRCGAKFAARFVAGACTVLACFLALPALAAEPAPGITEDTPPGCTAVYQKGLQLLREFDTRLPAAVRTFATTSVERGVTEGRSRPQAFAYVGAAAALRGNYEVAVWAGLNNAKLSWQAVSVTSVGVYLFYLDRAPEAETFLNCARLMNPRSPYPLEALAMIAFKRKNHALAIDLIEQAVKRLPRDTNILYTAGIIHLKGGQQAKGRSYLWKAQARRPGDKTFEEAAKAADPSGQNKPKPPADALAKLIGQTFAYLDETLERGESLAAYATYLTKLMKPAKPWAAVSTEALRNRIAASKRRILESEKAARTAVSSAVPAQNVPLTWNVAVSRCIEAYFDAFSAYQDIAKEAWPMQHLLARAIGIDADRLLQDAFKYAGYTLLRQERRHGLALASHEAHLEVLRVAQVCEKAGTNPDECLRRAHGQWCRKMKPLTRKMRSIAESNINAASSGFRGAARLEFLYTRTVAGDAADFVRRAVAVLRPIPDKFMADQGVRAASPESLSRLAKLGFKAYVGGFAQSQAFLVQLTYQGMVTDIDSLRREVKDADYAVEYYCAEAKPDLEQPPIDKEIDAVIAALQASSEVEGSPTFECAIKAGDFMTIEIKLPDEGILPKIGVVVGAEKDAIFTVKAEGQPGSDRRGVELSAGASDANILAADVSAKVWAKDGGSQPADFGVELEGKLGGGFEKGGYGVACYVLKATANVNARAFGESYARAMRN